MSQDTPRTNSLSMVQSDSEYQPFESVYQQQTFESLKSVLSKVPIEVLQLTTEYAETLCTHCGKNEKANEEWKTFEDGTVYCDSCIRQLCLCRICNEIILTPLGLGNCNACNRPTCDNCVIDFQKHSYCISCFGWRSGGHSDDEDFNAQ